MTSDRPPSRMRHFPVFHNDWHLYCCAAAVPRYCSCVQDAVDRGWLRTERNCIDSMPNMDAVLPTALEIASAMQYLHAHDVIHGDLSGEK